MFNNAGIDKRSGRRFLMGNCKVKSLCNTAMTARLLGCVCGPAFHEVGRAWFRKHGASKSSALTHKFGHIVHPCH